jgi:hypothetical protein
MVLMRSLDTEPTNQIILSTHDDRLYTQMWMKATHTSTVIEIFDEGSFVRESDYVMRFPMTTTTEL